MFPSTVSRGPSVPLKVEALEDRCLPSTTQYVTALYQDVLHRTPSPAEAAGWVNLINAGATPDAVALDFATSAEYRTDVVTNDYRLYLGRTASASEIGGWVRALDAGTNEFTVQASFLASQEFFAKNGSAIKPWLQSIYRDVLGRAADSSGLAGWAQSVQDGATRMQVALDIATSPEAFGRLVAAAYNDFLGRPPDPVGQANWIAALQQGLMPSQLAARMISSQEFIARQGGLDVNPGVPSSAPFIEPGSIDTFIDPFFFPIGAPIPIGCGCTGIGFTGGGFTGGGFTGGGFSGGFTGGFSGGSGT